jgi:hypothetical protein
MVQPNPEHESKRKKKLLIYLAIGILIFIFIIIPSATLTGLWISVRQKRAERPPQVKVPNVCHGNCGLCALPLSIFPPHHN